MTPAAAERPSTVITVFRVVAACAPSEPARCGSSPRFPVRSDQPRAGARPNDQTPTLRNHGTIIALAGVGAAGSKVWRTDPTTAPNSARTRPARQVPVHCGPGRTGLVAKQAFHGDRRVRWPLGRGSRARPERPPRDEDPRVLAEFPRRSCSVVSDEHQLRRGA